VQCANAFPICSINSSSTTKSCASPFTLFLGGIISWSADTKRPMLKETEVSLICSSTLSVRPSPVFWSTYQNGSPVKTLQHFSITLSTPRNGSILEVPVRVSAHRTERYNGNALDLHSGGAWLKSWPEGQLSQIIPGFSPVSPCPYSTSIPFDYVIQSTPHRRHMHSLRCWESWNKQETSYTARATYYSDRICCNFTQSLHNTYERLQRNRCQQPPFKSPSTHYALLHSIFHCYVTSALWTA
jgi:hypothetical protein